MVTTAFVLLAYGCDPATDVAVTNGCDFSVWVRINGEEPPTEVRPAEKITTQRIGKGATVLWSKARYGPVKVLEISHKGGPVVIEGPACG